MGDGQKVALRLQGSTYFQTYSLSFSEPWFGGKNLYNLAHLSRTVNSLIIIMLQELLIEAKVLIFLQYKLV